MFSIWISHFINQPIDRPSSDNICLCLCLGGNTTPTRFHHRGMARHSTSGIVSGWLSPQPQPSLSILSCLPSSSSAHLQDDTYLPLWVCFSSALPCLSIPTHGMEDQQSVCLSLQPIRTLACFVSFCFNFQSVCFVSFQTVVSQLQGALKRRGYHHGGGTGGRDRGRTDVGVPGCWSGDGCRVDYLWMAGC